MRDASLANLRLAVFSDTFTPQLNGLSRTLEYLTRAVRSLGGEIRVFTTDDPCSTPDADVRRIPSIPFFAYPELRIALPVATRLAGEVRRWRPTLIHCASPFSLGLIGRRIARMSNIPLVSSYHTDFSALARCYGLGAFSRPNRAFARWFHNGGLRTFCPTRAIEAQLVRDGFSNTRIWGSGVDHTAFRPSARCDAMRARLGAGDDTVVVTYVGRIAPEKGVFTALDAMRIVNERSQNAAGRSPRVIMAFAGDGPSLRKARAVAPPNTVFLGRLDQPALGECFASSDIFLFPSAVDTFGNVLLEAMASGLPVVAADVPQTREIVGRAGAFFPARDGAAAAREILELVHSVQRRQAARVIALSISAEISWDSVFDRLFAEYRDVLNWDHSPSTGMAGPSYPAPQTATRVYARR